MCKKKYKKRIEKKLNDLFIACANSVLPFLAYFVCIQITKICSYI